MLQTKINKKYLLAQMKYLAKELKALEQKQIMQNQKATKMFLLDLISSIKATLDNKNYYISMQGA